MSKVTSTHGGLNRGPLFRENQNQIDGKGGEGGRGGRGREPLK